MLAGRRHCCGPEGVRAPRVRLVSYRGSHHRTHPSRVAVSNSYAGAPHKSVKVSPSRHLLQTSAPRFPRSLTSLRAGHAL
eukprot:6210817-Pleurochrysis_carterae.AAC.1